MSPAGAFTLVAVLGFLQAVCAFRGGRRPAEVLIGATCWCLPLGFGGLSVAYFLFRFLGGAGFGALPLLGYSAVVAAAFFLVPRMRTGATGPVDDDSPRLHLAALGLLVIVLAAALFMMHRADRRHSYGGYDSMAIWQTSARALRGAHDPGEALRALPPAHHGDYPLLVPASLAALWELCDDESSGIQVTLAALLYLAVPLALFAALRGFVGGTRAALAAAALAATPELIEYSQLQYVDPILSGLVVLALAGLGGLLCGEGVRGAPPALAGLALGFLPWAKNEGIVLALLIFGVFLAQLTFSRKLGPTRFRVLVPVLALGLPMLVVELLFKVAWAPTNDLVAHSGGIVEKLTDLDRWTQVGRAFADEWNPLARADDRPLGSQRWGLGWVFVAVALLLTRRRRLAAPEARLSLAFVLIASAAWFGVYLITPARLEWHLPTSLHRLLLQLLPAWIYTAVLLGEAPGQRTRPPENGSPTASEVLPIGLEPMTR